jgi:hypothetical protein
MNEPIVTCYRCRAEIRPRVIAPAMPPFTTHETRDYWCDKCGPLVYWTAEVSSVATDQRNDEPRREPEPSGATKP